MSSDLVLPAVLDDEQVPDHLRVVPDPPPEPELVKRKKPRKAPGAAKSGSMARHPSGSARPAKRAPVDAEIYARTVTAHGYDPLEGR